jgi:hypothetical protein
MAALPLQRVAGEERGPRERLAPHDSRHRRRDRAG